MNRQFGGVLVLLVGLLVAFAVPRVLDAGVAGTASRAPVPGPPVAGSCLSLGSELVPSADWLVPTQLPEFATVPCSDPHDVEVAWAWEPGVWESPVVPPPPELSDPCLPAWDFYDQSSELRLDRWQLNLVYINMQLVSAPPTQSAGEMGWHACIVSPPHQVPYRGLLYGVNDPTKRPAAFGFCGTSEAVNSYLVPCDQPHVSETLATSWSSIPDDPSLAAGMEPLPDEQGLFDECTKLSADLLDRKDATFGGQLKVVIDLDVYSADQVWVDVNADDDITNDEFFPGASTTATCGIATADGSRLIDTVVGIGDNPLPVQK